MDFALFKSYRIPEEVEKVSTSQGGIYQFGLRFPTNYELGCDEKSVVNVSTTTKVLLGVIKRYERVFLGEELRGRIQTPNKVSHIKKVYEISAVSGLEMYASCFTQNYLEQDTSEKKILDLINSLRLAYEMVPPLYVGMTYKQSLQGRLLQHISGDSVFSSELEKYELSWNHLVYRCTEVEPEDRAGIERIEDIVQAMFKPVFSKK